MDHHLDQHPVLHAIEEMDSALKDVADVEPTFMSTADKKAALVGLARVRARLDELRLRVQVASADVAADDGFRDVAAWLDHHNRLDRPVARTEQRVADAIEGRWRLVQAGMRDGVVDLAQAEAITRALDKLPDHLDPQVVAMAEERLVAEAAAHGPRELRIMGRRILDVIAPEIAEEQERRALEAEEQAAEARTWLTGRRGGEGRTKIAGEIADPVWDRLVTLPRGLPLTPPARPGPGSGAGEPGRPPPVRDAAGLCLRLVPRAPGPATAPDPRRRRHHRHGDHRPSEPGRAGRLRRRRHHR